MGISWRGRTWSLLLAAFCAICMILVHLMCLAILAPLAIHLASLGWRATQRRGWALGGAAVVAAALGGLSWPYCYYLAHNYSPSLPIGTSLWAGWFFPLLGGHHLTAAGLGNILGDDWQYTTGRVLPYLVVAAQTISLAAYPAVWVGMILAFRSWRRVLNDRSADSGRSSGFHRVGDVALPIPFGRQPPCVGWSAIFQRDVDRLRHLRVAGGGLALGASKRSSPGTPGEGWGEGSSDREERPSPRPLPEYRERENGGMSHRSVLLRTALPLYAASLLIVLGSMVYKISRDGGAWSDNYGVALDEQLRALALIQQFSPASPRQISVRQWTDHPWVLDRDLPALVPTPSCATAQAADHRGISQRLPRRCAVIRQRSATE